MTVQALKTPAALLDSREAINILVVEDNFVSLAFLRAQLEEKGHNVLEAKNGKEAIDILQRDPSQIDVVLMDREMPVMDGLTAVKRIKNNPTCRRIPVIMITGADSAEDMREGLNAGVFYYLTKPVEEEVLKSVLSAAVREVDRTRMLGEEKTSNEISFKLADTCRFTFKTLEEAESLVTFLANFFPDPSRVIPGISELIINALEHGKLGLGYEGKGMLPDNDVWRSEIMRLEALPEHSEKTITVTLLRKKEGVFLAIEDPGPGFEWRKYLKIDPARAGDSHGRGIAQARATSFDSVNYNEAGNKVVAMVSFEERIEW